MKKFEYRIIFVYLVSASSQCIMADEVGMSGWELVCVTPEYLFFKREIL